MEKAWQQVTPWWRVSWTHHLIMSWRSSEQREHWRERQTLGHHVFSTMVGCVPSKQNPKGILLVLRCFSKVVLLWPH